MDKTQPSEQPRTGAADCQGTHHYGLCTSCSTYFAAAPDPVASPADLDRDILAAITHEPDFNALMASSDWYAYADYIIERLGAVASPPPLDVERLAKALHEVLCITQPTQPPRERLWHVQEAKDIAAEYERLGQPVAEEGEYGPLG